MEKISSAEKPKTSEERVAEIKSRVPQEDVDKLSRGDVRLGEGIEIKGEGSDRKLIIRILPEDPEYQEMQEAIDKAAKEEMKFANAMVKLEEKQRWGEANREIMQEIAELRSRDRDPYNLKILEERVRYMEDTQAILDEHFEELKKTRTDAALDAINRWKAEYKRRAGENKLDRFFRETYRHIAETEDGDKFSRETSHFLAALFYCQELQDRDAIDIVIDKRTEKT